MFLHLSVILLTGGHAWLLGGGMRGCSWGGHAWRRGGMCGEGGCAWQRRGMCGKGGHAWYAPPDPRDTAGHCAGGTHPTGMHSCSSYFRCIPSILTTESNIVSFDRYSPCMNSNSSSRLSSSFPGSMDSPGGYTRITSRSESST